jgi:hypothetical protein
MGYRSTGGENSLRFALSRDGIRDFDRAARDRRVRKMYGPPKK